MKTTRLKRTLRTRTAAQEKLLRWSGPVDEARLNRTLLRLMRAVRDRQHLSLHALEARSGIKRPQLRKLEQELMQLTLFTLVQWPAPGHRGPAATGVAGAAAAASVPAMNGPA